MRRFVLFVIFVIGYVKSKGYCNTLVLCTVYCVATTMTTEGNCNGKKNEKYTRGINSFSW